MGCGMITRGHVPWCTILAPTGMKLQGAAAPIVLSDCYSCIECVCIFERRFGALWSSEYNYKALAGQLQHSLAAPDASWAPPLLPIIKYCEHMHYESPHLIASRLQQPQLWPPVQESRIFEHAKKRCPLAAATLQQRFMDYNK